MRRAGLRQQKLINKKTSIVGKQRGASLCRWAAVWESLWAGCYFCVFHTSPLQHATAVTMPAARSHAWETVKAFLYQSAWIPHESKQKDCSTNYNHSIYISPFLKRARAHYDGRREKTQDNKNNKVAFYPQAKWCNCMLVEPLSQQVSHLGGACETALDFYRLMWPSQKGTALALWGKQSLPSFKVNRKPQWSVYVPTLTVNYSLVHIIPQKP